MSEHANQNENDIKNTEERPDLSGDKGAQFSDADLDKVAGGISKSMDWASPLSAQFAINGKRE